VRDQRLARPTTDIDVVVPAHAIGLARAVADEFKGAFYALDSARDIGRALVPAPDGQIAVDISRVQGRAIEQDLSQRDFTINAMALDLKSDPLLLLDLHEGQSDLDAKVIRALSPSTFLDDPVRLLRALRLEAELGFRLEDDTENWIRRDSSLLSSVSLERVQHELVLLLRMPGAATRIRKLDLCHLLGPTLPEVLDLKGVTQSEPHHLDVFEHTLQTLNRLEAILESLAPAERGLDRPLPGSSWLEEPLALLAQRIAPLSERITAHLDTHTSADRDIRGMLKWAALLHDVGKPHTRSTDTDGRIRFIGHELNGAGLAEEILQRLRFSGREALLIRDIVRHHLRPSQLAREPALTRRAIYRFFRDTGATGIEICILSLADHLATWGENLIPSRWLRRLDTVETLLTSFFCQREVAVVPDPLISGDDLIVLLGMQQGPDIGAVLEGVREAQAAGEVSSRDDALALAGELLESLT
jgi:putative nucleotidyltransferase with HDIG domain